MSTSDIPSHLRLYDEEYFTGGEAVSGYADYAQCRDLLERWAGMVEALARPSSVLDVGCAYGFVVEFFRRLGVPAYGVDPSAFALSRVRPAIRPYLRHGALPDLPDLSGNFSAPESEPGRFDVVTCTEVLEHLPEALVEPSIQALVDKTDRLLICLIMVEGHPTAHDDAGHLCLKDHEWWSLALDHPAVKRRDDLERILNNDPLSRTMRWSGRLFVRERIK